MRNHQKNKEPWLAAALSLNIVGLGQMYAGNFWRGFSLLFLWVTFIVLALYQLFNIHGKTIYALIFLFLIVLIMLISIIDAWKIVRKQNDLEFEKIRKTTRDPLLAVFLNLLWPGAGQFYLKNWLLGLLFAVILPTLGGGIFIWLIYFKNTITLSDAKLHYGFLGYLLQIISIICCFINVKRKYKSIILIFTFLAVYNIGLEQLTHYFKINYAELFKMSSEVMMPTINKDDRVICLKYNKNEIKHGDVIVFKPLEYPKSLYMMRCVGIPNDRLTTSNNKIFINNRFISYFPTNIYDSILLNQIFKTGNKGITVPTNHYFMIGDNKSSSFDSRYWGFLPSSNIQGRITKIYWPLSRENVLTNYIPNN